MFNKVVRRLSKNKNAKAIANNFGYLMLLQISSYLFPLITIPYLSRIIGVDGFGKIAFASAVIVWFQTISYWGFDYTATRDVARNRENKDKISEIFSDVLWARLLLMAISLLILLAMCITIPYFNKNISILLATFLIIPGSIFYPIWFFQAIEDMKYITIFNLGSKILFTICVFVFIKDQDDYILQPLFVSLGLIISGLFSFYLIAFKWKIKIYKPNLSRVFNVIYKSKDMFINSIMPNLYNSFSTVLLGFYAGSKANGLLDAGNKFVNISQQFMMVSTKVIYPYFSRKLNYHNLYMNINLLISTLISIALFVMAPTIINIFFTEEFKPSITVLKIMSASIVFSSLIQGYGVNYLAIKGYESRLRNITTWCSLFGFLTAFPLIHFYQYIGAAITITLTRGLLGFFITLEALKIKGIGD